LVDYVFLPDWCFLDASLYPDGVVPVIFIQDCRELIAIVLKAEKEFGIPRFSPLPKHSIQVEM
jgi:hypothetical protein